MWNLYLSLFLLLDSRLLRAIADSAVSLTLPKPASGASVIQGSAHQSHYGLAGFLAKPSFELLSPRSTIVQLCN